jgi:hypothetical protein
MIKLGPGVYVDDDEALHLVVPEMLTAAGYPDTADNRETLIRAARDVFAQDGKVVVEVDGE